MKIDFKILFIVLLIGVVLFMGYRLYFGNKNISNDIILIELRKENDNLKREYDTLKMNSDSLKGELDSLNELSNPKYDEIEYLKKVIFEYKKSSNVIFKELNEIKNKLYEDAQKIEDIKNNQTIKNDSMLIESLKNKLEL
jgi:chromosome segregation ATPase